jgi:hypothetical protein
MYKMIVILEVILLRILFQVMRMVWVLCMMLLPLLWRYE